MKFTLNIQSSEQLANICGGLDKNIENIATNLGVNISNKGSDFNIKGENSALAVSVLQDLLIVSETKAIDFSDIDLCIKSLNSPNGEVKSVTSQLKPVENIFILEALISKIMSMQL